MLLKFLFQFEKPGRRDDFDYPQMAEESIGKALNDSKLSYKDVQQAFVGYVFGKWRLYIWGIKRFNKLLFYGVILS